MRKKRFRLGADEIRPLAPGRGRCFASDMITVEGYKVGWMYREVPDDLDDSGWRFFAGLETQAYADESAHFGAYDVNTIANYDPEIIPLLDQLPGVSYERPPEGGAFARVDNWSPPTEG